MLRLSKRQRYWVDFLLAMTEKEIKARYKSAVLGFLWVILNPLFQMMVIGIVFQFIMNQSIEHYFLYLFSGLLGWNFFSSTITKTAPMIVYERGIIQKASFPRDTIILSHVLANLFHTIIGYALLLVVSLFVVHISPVKVCIFVLTLIFLTLFTAGLSLLFSALTVKYRDVAFFVNALIPLVFYCTPIIYSSTSLPEYLRTVLYINPLAVFTQVAQSTFAGSVSVELPGYMYFIVCTITIFLGGLKVFIKESYFFDDWI